MAVAKTKKAKTRKNVPWRGWKNERPSARERTKMLKSCGRKCFLGPKKSFPVCKKNTCKVSRKGVYAAYVRARQTHRAGISHKAKRKLRALRRSKTKRKRKGWSAPK